MELYSVENFVTFDHFVSWLFSSVPEFYINVFMLLCLLSLLHELLKWGRRF